VPPPNWWKLDAIGCVEDQPQPVPIPVRLRLVEDDSVAIPWDMRVSKTSNFVGKIEILLGQITIKVEKIATFIGQI